MPDIILYRGEPNPNDVRLRGVTTNFDGALMMAMNRPWRDIAFDSPQVVASGMAPPDLINP